MVRITWALLMLVLLVIPCRAIDISGNWEFTVETPAGGGNPSFVFKQDGEKLTGTYSGLFGKAPISGTVKGDDIEFKVELSSSEVSGTYRYKGKIESPTQMKGEVELGDVGKGTWTANKK